MRNNGRKHLVQEDMMQIFETIHKFMKGSIQQFPQLAQNTAHMDLNQNIIILINDMVTKMILRVELHD